MESMPIWLWTKQMLQWFLGFLWHTTYCNQPFIYVNQTSLHLLRMISIDNGLIYASLPSQLKRSSNLWMTQIWVQSHYYQLNRNVCWTSHLSWHTTKKSFGLPKLFMSITFSNALILIKVFLPQPLPTLMATWNII